MTSVWYGNYSSEAISNTMRGSQDMTTLYSGEMPGPPAYSYSINIPWNFEIVRARASDTLTFNSNYPQYGQFSLYIPPPDDYYRETKAWFEITWKKEGDTDDYYSDARTSQTNWTGYIVEGVTPNRTLTWRTEYQTFDSISNNLMPDEKAMEVVFYENDRERLDIRHSSSLNEQIQTNFYYMEDLPADYPYVPEDVGPTYSNTFYLKYNGTDNEGRRYNLNDQWSVPYSGGGSSGGSGGAPTFGTGTAFDYNRVWNDAGLANTSTTTGLVAIYEQSNNYIYITNIQNVANTRLLPRKFKVNEQLYSNSGPEVNVQTMDQIIYLDTAPGANGYGFKSNQTITQTLPDGSIVSGVVVQENVSPPLVYVTNSNAKFQKYPITNGTAKANVVGSLSPQLKGEVVFFVPYYIINRNGQWTDIKWEANGNYTFGESVNSLTGDYLTLDPRAATAEQLANVDGIYLVANYNDTQGLIPRGNIKDRWTDPANTYYGIALNYDNDPTGYPMVLDVTGTDQGYLNNYYGGTFWVLTGGRIEVNYADGNWEDRYTHRGNKAFMVYDNDDPVVQIGGNTSSFYRTLTSKAAFGEGSDEVREETANLWVEWSSLFQLTYSGNVNVINIIKPDVAANVFGSNYSEGQQDPDKVWVTPITIVADIGKKIKRKAWASANVMWSNGIPPKEIDRYNRRVFHLVNIHDPKNPANNHIWYGFNSSGEQLFPWYRPNRTHTFTITYSWNSSGGTDLDSRTWITLPNETYDWQNNIVGWSYNDPQTKMGWRPNPNTSSYMTFSGDDTSSGGTETVVIPIDTVAYNHPSLQAKTTHQIGWANTYTAGNVVYTQITNNMNGRTGMTKLYEYGVSPFSLTVPVNIPWSMEQPRDDIATTLYVETGYDGGFYTDNVVVGATITFSKDGLYSQSNNKSEVRLLGANNQSDPTLKPLYWGSKLEGSAPNRTLTIRGEFCDDWDFYYFANGMTRSTSTANTAVQYEAEMKFFENNPKVYEVHYGQVKQTYYYTADYPNTNMNYWMWSWRNIDFQYTNVIPYNNNAYIIGIGANKSYRVDMTNDGKTIVPTYYDFLESYIDIHCGAYWYNTRNSGNFTFKIKNDVTGYEYTFTPNVQHRNIVGIGPNEFAVFRLYLDYLRLERII